MYRVKLGERICDEISTTSNEQHNRTSTQPRHTGRVTPSAQSSSGVIKSQPTNQPSTIAGLTESRCVGGVTPLAQSLSGVIKSQPTNQTSTTTGHQRNREVRDESPP